MKFIDKIAKKFVKSATDEIALEIEEVKKAVFDGLPTIVTIGVLVYTLASFRSSPKKTVQNGATIIQHIYYGGTINVKH